MQPDLNVSSLLRRLADAGVDFVVIGGVAVIAHGYERNTKDLDICYSPDHANLEALGDMLVGLGARLRGIPEEVPFIPDAATLRRMQILTLDTPHGGLDLLVDPQGSPGYQALKSNAEPIDFEGFEVLIASIEDLLTMKRAANRPRDHPDIDALTTIQRMRRNA
ncbi:MAG: nucleotidyltransferase [Solirubrobacteraceae bacterium]